MSVRDDFQRGNASWFAGILVQRWFLSMRFILICKKCLWGMISGEEMHPDLLKMSVRDDSQRGNASWFDGNVCEGWFPTEKFILICRKSQWGMISSGEIDPDLIKMSERDDFKRGNASWFARNALEGWFPTRKFILISRKCLRGIISSGEIYPD